MQTLSLSDFHRDRAARDGLMSRCKACNIARAREWEVKNPERRRERARANRERVNARRRARYKPKRKPRRPALWKRCSQCGSTKAIDDFYRWKEGYDGRTPECADCSKARFSRYAVENAEKIRAYSKRRYAQNPERFRAKARRWRENHPDELAEYNKRHYSENAEYYKSHAKAWRQRHLEYARARDRARAKTPEGRAYRRQWEAENSERLRSYRLKRRAIVAQAPTVPFTSAQLEQRLSMFPGCWMCGGAPESVDHVKPLNKGGPHLLANLRPACVSCNSRKQDRWPYPTEVAS